MSKVQLFKTWFPLFLHLSTPTTLTNSPVTPSTQNPPLAHPEIQGVRNGFGVKIVYIVV